MLCPAYKPSYGFSWILDMYVMFSEIKPSINQSIIIQGCQWEVIIQGCQWEVIIRGCQWEVIIQGCHYTGMPTGSHYTGMPMGSHYTGMPMGSHYTGMPMGSHYTGMPMGSHYTGMPMGSHYTGMPMESHKKRGTTFCGKRVCVCNTRAMLHRGHAKAPKGRRERNISLKEYAPVRKVIFWCENAIPTVPRKIGIPDFSSTARHGRRPFLNT